MFGRYKGPQILGLTWLSTQPDVGVLAPPTGRTVRLPPPASSSGLCALDWASSLSEEGVHPFRDGKVPYLCFCVLRAATEP